jgi:hypothetical protein
LRCGGLQFGFPAQMYAITWDAIPVTVSVVDVVDTFTALACVVSLATHAGADVNAGLNVRVCPGHI